MASVSHILCISMLSSDSVLREWGILASLNVTRCYRMALDDMSNFRLGYESHDERLFSTRPKQCQKDIKHFNFTIKHLLIEKHKYMSAYGERCSLMLRHRHFGV
jgi:hypothetical protein